MHKDSIIDDIKKNSEYILKKIFFSYLSKMIRNKILHKMFLSIVFHVIIYVLLIYQINLIHLEVIWYDRLILTLLWFCIIYCYKSDNF